MKNFILYILPILLLSFKGFAQEFDEKYMLINNEGSSGLLFFTNDSVVEMHPYITHGLSLTEKKEYNYKVKNDTLTIITDQGELELVNRQDYMLNERKQMLYVRRADFPKKPDIIVFLDGEEYRMKEGRPNRKLNKELKKLSGYDTKVVTGYNAFKEYGYKYSFGVIEIMPK